MSDDQINKPFKHIQKEFAEIKTELSTKSRNEDMQRVPSILNDLAKMMEIKEDERLVIGHQLDRLDKWTYELVDKIGHKLTV